MKTLKKICGVYVISVLLMLVLPKITQAQEGGYISDQEFYDNLQPYGTWIDDPDYGNVWVPDTDDDFRPYATRGHWVLTDYGNTWVSDYPWGWATFHYGRWRYDDYYGWEWIPGHHWAPAWVSWRHGGGYYGWAPLMPGISISISFGRSYHIPDNYWVCAPQAYINRPNIYNYYVPSSRSVTIIHNTTIINTTRVYNNQTYITGPPVQEVRQVTHQNVRVYTVNNINRPSTTTINNNTINIYRPAVQANTNAHPTRVVNAVAYKQQHPQLAIASHGGGAPAFNHNNAAQLAQVAKAPAPDNKVVRVNPVPPRPGVSTTNSRAVNQPKQMQTVQQAQQRSHPQQQAQPQARQPAQQTRQEAEQRVQQQTQQQAQQRAQQQAQQQAQQRAQQQAQQQAQQRAQQAQQQAQQRAQQQAQQQTQQRAQQQTQQRAQQQAQQRAQQQAQQQAQ